MTRSEDTPTSRNTEPGSRRREIVRFAWLSLFILSVVGLLIWLGFWQLQRLEWKEGLLAAIHERSEAPPEPVEKAIADARAGKDIEYTRVAVEGRYEHDKERYLYAISPQSDPGWHVITPVKMDDGTIVLVDRGFVFNRYKDPATRPEAQTEGEVRIVGLVRQAQEPNAFTPENEPDRNRWYWRDLDGIEKSIFPNGQADVAPFFVEAVAGEVSGNGPVGGQTNLTLPNNHLQYAWTWFCMAVVAAGSYLAFAWTIFGKRRE